MRGTTAIPTEPAALAQWLGELVSPLTEVSTLEQFSRVLVTQVRQVTDAEYVAFYLLDPGGGRLQMFAQDGFTAEERGEAERTAWERHPGAVVRSRQVLHVPDVEVMPHQSQSDVRRRHVVRSRLFVPVDSEAQCVGTLGVASSLPHHFEPLDITALTFLCRMTGVVHRNLWRERALREQMERSEAQRQELRALSAPIAEVAPGVLVLPLIGRLDEERGAELTERLLRAVVERRARRVLLDLTGLDARGDGTEVIERIVGALELVGARAWLSGLSPALVIELSASEVRLPPGRTFATLAQALVASR